MKKLTLLTLLALLAMLFGVSTTNVAAAIGTPTLVGTNGNFTADTSIAVAVPAAGVDVTNTIIVTFAMSNVSGTVSVSDSSGNAYTSDVDITGNGIRTLIFSAPVTSALSSGDTITITYPSVAAKGVSIYSVSGLLPASALDKTATGTGVSTSPLTAATATTSQANELLIGAIGGGYHASTTFTAGTSYTALTPALGDSGTSGTSATIQPEYRIVSATSAYTASGTLGSSRSWAAAIATFKATGTTAQTITFNSPGNQTYGVAPITLGATASSGLAVIYTVTSGPATVAGNVLTITGAGSVTIEASQPGDATYSPATSVRQTITVAPLAVTLSGTRAYDGTTVASASDLTVANTIGSDGVTLSGNGGLAGKDVGSQAISLLATPVRMNSATGAVGTAASSSFTVTVPAPTDGNTLIAVISKRGVGQVSSITQSGATWVRAIQSSNSFYTATEIWYASGVSGAGTSVAINMSATTNAAAVVMEYSGLLTSSPVDVTATATNRSTGAFTGSATSTQANELWIGGISLTNSGYTLGAPTNSFTAVASAQSGNATAANNSKIYALERIVTATGPAVSGGTVSTSSHWAGAMATFEAVLPSGTTLALGGSAAGNYTLTGLSGSMTITNKALTVSGLTANNKIYDGNTTATLSGTAALQAAEAAGTGTTSDGKPYTGDDVTLGGTAVGAFADPNVGTAKPVTVTGNTLNGAQVTDYLLIQQTGLTANITPGPASSISFVQGPPVSVVAGATFSPNVTVLVEDAFNNVIPGISVSMTLNGGGTLGGTVTQTADATGTATFNNLTVNQTGSKTLTASVTTNLALNVTSSSFTVTPGAIDHYAVSAATATRGTAFNVTATAQDVNNNTVTTDSSTVVTMTSSTGNALFDGNGDSSFNDNSNTLSGGTFTISTKDNFAETNTITAMDASSKTGSTVVTVNGITGDFRSQASGYWTNSAIWQTNNGSSWVTASFPPTNTTTTTGEINIRSPNSVTNPASVSVALGQYVLDAGGVNAINSGVTLTVGNGVANGIIRNGTGAGILAESGTGNLLTLNGSITNTGGLAISGGTVSVTNVTTTGVRQIGNGVITFDTGGTLLNTGTGGQTLTNNITLNTGGGVITMSGPTMTLTGTISSGGGLTSSGSDLILNPGSANNIGTMTVNSGRLFVSSANAIANSAVLHINNGATLDFQYTATPLNTMTFASGSCLANRSGTLIVSTANVTFPSAGTIIFNQDDQTTTPILINGNYPTLTNDLTIQVGGSSTSVGIVTNAGAISGSFGLIKTSTGTLVLSGTNTYTGGTTVSAGNIDVKSTGSLGSNDVTVATSATLTLESTNSIASTANLLLNTSTVVTNNFTGTNNIAGLSFDGGTTFQAGGTWGTNSVAHTNTVFFKGTGKLNVIGRTTTTALGSSLNPSTYGQSVTFTATVSGEGGPPTGTVQFKTNGVNFGSAVTLSGGSATSTAISTLSAGNYTVTAVYSGDSNFIGSTGTLSGGQTVNKVTPVISWSNPADITYGTALSGTQLNATSGGVAGNFVYTPVSGTVLNAGAGQTLSVQFTPTDTADYNTPAAKNVTINVNKANQTVAFTSGSSVTKTYGNAAFADVATNTSGGTVTYSSDNTSVATINSSGTVTIVSAGTAHILADSAASANYNAAPQASQTLTVNSATPAFTGLSSVTNSYGVTNIILIGKLSAAGPVYPVNGDAVSVTINGFTVSGTVTNSTGGFWINYNDASLTTNGVSASPYTITYNYAGNGAVSMASASDGSTSLKIIPATPVLTLMASAITYSQKLADSSLSGCVATNAQNNMAVAGSFAFQDDTIAPNAGTYGASVIFTPNDTVDYNNVTNTVSVTVNKADSTVTVTGTTTFTYTGSSQGPNTANVTGSSGTVTYSYVGVSGTSYGPSATQPTGAGSYTVTATLAADANYNGATSSATAFTIAKADSSVTPIVGSYTYNGSPQGPNTSTVTGSSGAVTYSYVGVSGTTYGASATQPTEAGSYTVTATLAADANYNGASSSATAFAIAQATASFTGLSSVTNSYGVTNLILTGELSAGDPVYPANGDAVSATINGVSVNGTVTNDTGGFWINYNDASLTTNGVSGSPYTITYNYAGNDSVSMASASDSSTTLTIVPETPVLTLVASTITYGQTLADSSLSGSVATNAENNEQVTGGFAFEDSTITPDAGTYSASVIFTPEDTTDYNTVTNNVDVTVNKAESSVTVTGTTSFTYTGSPQGPDTANVTGSTGAVTYSYVGVSGTTYGASATQPTEAGSYTVTATLAADANYNGASSSATAFAIAQATASFTGLSSVTNSYGVTNLILTGELSAGDPVYPANGDAVSATINGVSVNGTVTNDTGGFWINYNDASLTTNGVSGSPYTITYNYAGNDSVSMASASDSSTTLTIVPETPVLTLVASTITYGQTLADSSLSGSVATNAENNEQVTGGFAFEDSTITPDAGTYSASVIFTPEDTTDYNTVTNNVDVTVNKAESSVTVTGTTSFTYTGSPQGPDTANVTGSTGAVTYSYVGVSGTTYGASATQPTEAGSYTVTATVAADANYNGASSSATAFTINKATPVISWSDPSDITYGTALSGTQLNATSGGVAGSFDYTPPSGTVLNAGAGQTLSVQFTPTDTANYNTPSVKTVSINVNKAESSVTPIVGSYTYNGSPQGPNTSTVTGSSGAVTYSYVGVSGTTYGASATQPTEAGSYTVTATVAADANYNGASSSATAFTINKATPVISWSDPSDITYGTALSGTQLNATSGGVAGSFDYTPPSGTVLNAGAGQTLSVQFTPTDTANYNTPSVKTVSINVNKAESSVTPIVGSYTYTGSPQGPDTANVTGSTGAVTYSYVGVSGTTYGASATQPTEAGSYTVTATVAADANYNGASSSATAFTINKATPVISWSDPSDITYGTALSGTQLNATSGGVAGSFDYTPPSGTVLNAGAGQTLSVQFTPTDTANYNTPSVKTVSINVNKAESSVTPIVGSYTYNGSPQGPNTSTVTGSSGAVTYSYVGVSGTTYGASATQPTEAGSYTVTATVAADANYNGASSSATAFTINKATPVISWSDPSDITYGTALSGTQLNATSGGVAGSFDYTPPSGTVLNAGAGQTLSVQFTPTDTANYNTPSVKTVSINVNKAESSVTPIVGSYTYTGSPQGPDTANVTGSTGAVTYSYVGVSGTTYGASATQPTEAGSYTVTATVAADANYNGASSSATAFTINKATPVISWSDPSDITYGTALSGTQLNATSGGVAGSFDYTPPSGTVLNAGAGQTLSVQFTPTDTANYNTPSVKTVSINVNKAESSVTVTGTTSFTYTGSPQGPDTANVTGSTGAVTYSYVGVSGTTYGASATQPTDAGSYTVTATLAADANYNGASSSATAFAIAQATASFTGLSSVTNSYGVTNLILTGELSAGDPVYPANGDAVSATINGVSVNGTVTNDTGGFWINYNDASLTTNGVSGSPYTITYNYAGNDSVSMASASDSSTTLTIVPETPVLTLVASTITYGQTLADSSLSGSVATNAENNEQVTGGFAFEDSTITPDAGTYSASVIFTPEDTTDYNTVTNNVDVTVNKAESSVTVTGTTSFTYTGSPQGPDTANVTGSTGAVTYSYVGVSGTTYGASATQPTEAGSYTVTATVAADANYNGASSSATAFTINKATPVISWSDPSDITYGTALSGTQLNATSGGVAGSFDYTPPSGTVLNAGAGQTLSVQFTPTDTANYNTPSVKTVSINVNKAESSVTPIVGSYTYTGSPQGPDTANVTGSTGAVTYSYVGVSGTTYGASATQPTEAGSYTVTATVAADANYNGASSSATAFTINKATPVISWSDPSDITYGTALSGTQLNATSGGVAGSFDYTPPSGTVLNAGAGQTLSVQFTPTDTANYNTPSVKTVSINVNKAESSVTVTGTTSFTYTGSPQGPDTANVTGSTGAVTYSYVGVSGTTYGASATQPTEAGSYTVTATLAADANYNGASSSATAFAIAQATASFTGLSSVTNSYGVTNLILTGELSAGDPVYPANGDAVSATINGVSVNGTVTNDTGGFWINYNDASLTTNGVSGSPYTITYNYAGNDSVSMASASDSSTTLTIVPETPVLTLVASTITYGQTLADSSLSGSVATNAENNEQVTGGFAFEDSTITPDAGTYSASVIFTPEDTTDYNTVTNNVDVTVNPTPANQLVFTTPSQTLDAGVTSGAIIVERRDPYGSANSSDATITVNLTSSSSLLDVFRDISDSITITSVQIPKGSSSASFKYKDYIAGTLTITASSSGLTNATQQETISSTSSKPPTLKVDKAFKNKSVLSNDVAVTGTALDKDVGVAAVIYQVDGGLWEAAQLSVGAKGSSNWSATITPLSPTNHTFTAYALNNSGNPSKSITCTYTYRVWTPFTLTIKGGGALSKSKSLIKNTGTLPVEDGTTDLAQPGFFYYKATAAPGYLLSNWIFTADPVIYPGWSLISNCSAKFDVGFDMKTNLSLTVNFVTNQFSQCTTNAYYGLFMDDPVTFEKSGFITMKVKDGGVRTGKQAISGAIYVEGEKVPFTVNPNLEGYGTTVGQKKTPVRKKGSTDAFEVTVQLDLAGGYVATGMVVNVTAGWSTPFTAYRTPYDAQVLPPQTSPNGYVMRIISSGKGNEPGGDGYATLALGDKGVKPVVGLFGDGTKIGGVPLANIATNGMWAFYMPMYADSGKVYHGCAIGWLTFADGVIEGNLAWVKEAVTYTPKKATPYALGFTNESMNIESSGWTNNGAQPCFTGFTEGHVYVPVGGDMAADGVSSITQVWTNGGAKPVFGKNKPGVVTNDLNGVSLKLAAKTGKVSGKFVNDATIKPASGQIKFEYEGAILQNKNTAYGLQWLEDNPSSTGPVSVGP